VLDAEIQSALARLPAPPRPQGRPGVAELRAAAHGFIALAGPAPECPVSEQRIDGLSPLRVYTPVEAVGTCVFLHGGGFVRGDLDTHDVLCRRLAVGAGTEVIGVDYRLAPEHPFPAAWDDARAVVEYATARDRGPVCVAGDSAGGCLAASVALERRAELAGQLLLYPVTDATLGARSLTEYADGPFLTRDQVAWSWDQVRGGADPEDPRLSPLHAVNLTGAPPAYVLTGEHDPVHDDGVSYAGRLGDAAVPVELVQLEGAPHNLALLTGVSALAREAVDRAAAWLGQTIAKA
jgi:acetyl esterase